MQRHLHLGATKSRRKSTKIVLVRRSNSPYTIFSPNHYPCNFYLRATLRYENPSHSFSITHPCLQMNQRHTRDCSLNKRDQLYTLSPTLEVEVTSRWLTKILKSQKHSKQLSNLRLDQKLLNLSQQHLLYIAE